MKLNDFSKKLSSLEITALVIFIVYIIFPFKTPIILNGMINTPIGLVVLFIVTLFLFFYANPILGVVYIFVAYELVRRSSLVVSGVIDNSITRSSESEIEKAVEMNLMNPSHDISLEEDVVSKMAPTQIFNDSPEINVGFKPVIQRVKSASLYK
jgi:hypothetical protein